MRRASAFIGSRISTVCSSARAAGSTIEEAWAARAARTTAGRLIETDEVAAVIAFVAGVVSLAAIRSRDFARAAPGGQEGPRK